jgi:hypothetical protein
VCSIGGIRAFHVFSGCDVYHAVRANLRNQYLIIFYRDTANHFKPAVLPLDEFANKACKYFLQCPDIDVMDVSNYFKDANIYSVESFLPKVPKRKKDILQDGNKYICFGYQGDLFYNYMLKNNSVDTKPFIHIGTKADSTQYDPYYKNSNIDSMYTTIWPAMLPGTSGSPIFKVMLDRKKKPQIEFAGVQSGMNSKYNCSYTVKAEQLVYLISQLK